MRICRSIVADPKANQPIKALPVADIRRWRTLCSRSGGPQGKQPVILVFDDGVTFAGAFIQPSAVQHSDVPARVSDEPRVLQLQCALRDTFATHAQPIGDELLGHHKFITVQAVQAQQQPTA